MSSVDAVAMEKQGGSDLLLALGVVVCLGAGAGLTYWLSSISEPPRQMPALANIEGAALKSYGGQAARAAQPAKAAPVPVAQGGDEYLGLGFDTLSGFYYELKDMTETPAIKDPQLAVQQDQIPAPIKALKGKKVSVQGFMVPIKIEQGAAKSFLLVKDQSLCCFGRMPRMNEWISVKMSGGRAAKFISDQPVTVFGTLDVGEEIEKGEVLSIYRMDAEDVAGPLDL